MAKSFKHEHAGVTYRGSRDDEAIVTGSVTMGDKKWTLKGHPKINSTLGSYKHGDEIQIVVWNTNGTTFEKPRVQFNQDGTRKVHAWDTLEIFFPPEVWHSLVKKYIEAIKE
jgi:hypothetical protein